MGFLGGLGSLIGSVASSALGVHFNKKNMQNQSDIQTNQWQYQQSHAHQLEVEDLKNAGLNPILSAGASQVVSQPSVSSSNSGPDIMGDMSRLLEANSAKSQADTAKTNAETERIKAETDAKRQKVEASKSASDIKVNEETLKKIQAETTSEAERTKMIKQQIINLVADKDNAAKITAAQVNQLGALAYNLSSMVGIQNKIADAQVRKSDKEVEALQMDLDDIGRKIERDYYSDMDAQTIKKIGFLIDDILPVKGLRFGNVSRRK